MMDTQAQGYLAVPKAGTGPGILVLHAWWGLNDFIRSFCDRLAQAGFVALAPDLFGGTVLKTIEQAEQHSNAWDEAHAVPPILLPAVDELINHPKVVGHGLGVIGFSMGAYWSLWLAEMKPEVMRAIVIYYGTNGGGGDFRQSKAAFQGHFAEMDPYETSSRVQALEQTLKTTSCPISFYTYPGTSHWFFEADRPDAYNPKAAQLAWDRTVSLLKSYLVEA